MRRIRVEAEKCSGCRLCEMACSFSHEGRFSPSLSRVSVIKEDRYGLDYPVYCHQCEACPSIEACPTGALTRRELGVIHVDEACTGCGACVDACPYDAVKLNGSRPLICDLCGGEPACVERCPTEALAFVDCEGEAECPEEIFQAMLRRWGIVG